MKYTWSYEGKVLLAGKEWHQVQLGGNHVLPADERHVNAHWAEEISGFHGTSPNALAEILKFGGLKEGKVHDSSHAPFAVLDSEATACSTYAQGVFVEAIVYGHRHGYYTVGKTARARQMSGDEDWREQFLNAGPGRIITWKGTLYAKAAATQLHRFFIREDELGTYKQPRRRR